MSLNFYASIPVILALSPVIAGANGQDQLNTLGATEKAQGWVSLFDGHTTKGWHTFKGAGVNPRWHVGNDELTLEPSPTRQVSGADLETDERFGDFELILEWKISPRGNSGIFYRSPSDEVNHPWESGPEYQLLDNKGSSDPPIHQAGSVWDFYAPIKDVTRTVGEFNEARILVRSEHVEHWMNGVKLLSYELGSEDFKAKHTKSLFHQWTNYGTATRGSIVLQDEGRRVSFRNIRIRRLDAEPAHLDRGDVDVRSVDGSGRTE